VINWPEFNEALRARSVRWLASRFTGTQCLGSTISRSRTVSAAPDRKATDSKVSSRAEETQTGIRSTLFGSTA